MHDRDSRTTGGDGDASSEAPAIAALPGAGPTADAAPPRDDAPQAAGADAAGDAVAVYDAAGPRFLPSLRDSYRSLWRYRPFIHFFVVCRQRATLSRTILRDLWLLLEPLGQMLIYYFLVVIVFQRGGDGGPHPFVYILLGIVHYTFFQQALIGACQALLSNRSLMMQLQIEPLVFVAVTFYRRLRESIVPVALLLIAFVWLGPALSWRAAAYPLLLAELMLLVWAGCVAMATLVVFFRDLEQFSRIALRAMMYLAPVIYLVTFVPERFRPLYLANPVACLFNLFQWSLLGAPVPPAGAIAGLLIFTAALLGVAHYLYWRARRFFTKAF